MKTSVNFSDFIDAFRRYDRYDGYGYEALKVIFEYLEEYEESTGEEIELDVIAICCDYNVDTPLSIAENYGIEIDVNENDDEITQQVKDFLESATIMLGETADGQIVYQVF
jgi:hypothetical protein